MTKGLVLSGGGARGSFQVGALEYLYAVLGYRPEVIAGTSVGSVNALALAQAQTNADHLTRLNTLLAIWRGMTGPGDFYTVRPWFASLTRSESLNLGGGLSVRMEDAIVEVLFNSLIDNAMQSPSLAVLDPLETKMRDRTVFDPATLASGVPLRMVCVSLESGRVRYVTGRGRFLEDDNFTPVASALPRVAAIVSPHDTFTTAIGAVRNIIDAIAYQKKHGDRHAKWKTIAQLSLDLERARWRAEIAYDQLAAANASLSNPIEASVDPVIGALASSSIPGIFGPYKIGEEHYVDGGVREIVPVRAAVQTGATEIIAIVCSTQNMPHAGYAGAESFLSNMLGSLAGITLKEVVEDDLAGRGLGHVPVTVIIPNFDVHDGAEVDMGLIHISMAYGYMRAADVMSDLSAAERRAAEQLSDAITALRRETHLLSYLWTRPLEPGAHQMLQDLRLRKWLIRRLVESRIASSVEIHSTASLWFQTWEQGSSAVPIVSNPWYSFVSLGQTTPAVDPFDYIPDLWVYEEKGDLTGVYVIRAGAAFRGTAATIAPVLGATLTVNLTVPAGTTANIPAVPVPGTVLAEVAPTGMNVQTPGTWVVDGSRRYLLSAEAMTALGNPTAIGIPVGGLAQIPNGGTPYWLGGLALADSQPSLIHRWEPTSQVEGSQTTTAVLLWNRSDRTVTITSIQITTSADAAAGPLFTVERAMPFTVTPGQMGNVPVLFDAATSGEVSGIVAVNCDDPVAPLLRVPLATSVIPLGGHAELTLSPQPIGFGSSLVLTTVGEQLSITNVGTRQAALSASIVNEQPAGQFAVSTYALINPLSPGQSTSVYVSFTPTMRGKASAQVAIDMASATDVTTAQYQQRYLVDVSGSASAPVLTLAGAPRRRWPRPRSDTPTTIFDPLEVPIFRPLVDQEVELAHLDFGTAAPNTLAQASFWIRNVGDAPLEIGGVVVYNQSRFGIVDVTTFPASLAPGSELEVPSNFNAGPVAGQTSGGTFEVLSNDPFRPAASLSLIGRAAGPHLTAPPELLDMGGVANQATATLTFSSDGTDAVTIRSMKLADGQAFAVTSAPPLPVDLAPGDSLDVTVTFTASAPGQFQDNFSLRHDGSPSGASTILLRAAVA